jgi:acetyl-CoA synthetase
MKWVFDLKEEDTYWCSADIGWVTGHTAIVYGPLSAAATVSRTKALSIIPVRPLVAHR